MRNGQRYRNAKWSCVVRILALALVAALARPARANYITVTNMSLESGGKVQFDIAWENSWRESWTVGAVTVENWDAAWVFVKFRRTNETAYSHATLSTNDPDHSVPAGATLDTGLTAGRTVGGQAAEGVGAFIYRSATGNAGANDWQGIRLKWLHELDGVTVGESVDIQVHAIEMVYVAEGAFRVGTGVNETGSFKNGDLAGSFEVSAAWSGPRQDDPETDARRIAEQAGRLWGYSTSGTSTIGPAGYLHDDFPTGYSAFYCMKYEITQGQYAAFLNSLSSADAAARYYTGTGNRYSLAGSWPEITAGSPYVACNFLSWADGASYAAWAGLRPMTELEFEKACRGPVTPVAGEYAWGSTAVTQATGISNAGQANETASPAGANAAYNNHAGVQGPLRAGVFATGTSGRVAAGASYWGIMELSGNLWTRVVGVAANSAGNETRPRDFQGSHGAGSLTIPGDWPQADAIGAGFRGGNWAYAAPARATDRYHASNVTTARINLYGWRAVRGAPSGVGP